MHLSKYSSIEMHPQGVLISETCILSMYSPLEHASSACTLLWNMHPQHVLTSGTCILSMYSPIEHASSGFTHLWHMHQQACSHLWNMHPQDVLTTGTCILSMYSPLKLASSACTHLWNMHPQHVLADVVKAFHVLILVPGGLGYNVLCEKEKTSTINMLPYDFCI
jgi:hypothetical protein